MEERNSTPAKRPFDNKAAEIPNGGASSKRRPETHPPPPIPIPPGHAAFRLVCNVGTIGGVIGKSGTVISHLRKETASKIRVEEPVPGCDQRVVLVVAAEKPTKKVHLSSSPSPPSPPSSPSSSSFSPLEEEEVEVSAAQEALVRVFERVLQVEEEMEGGGVEEVTCKILAEKIQVGAVMGKGGKNIERIRKDTGVKITVLPPHKLPPCAAPTDELIQISGDALAVKKAIVAVSGRLQGSPLSGKAQVMNRALEKCCNTSLLGVQGGTHRGSFPPPASRMPTTHSPKGHPSFLSATNRTSVQDQRKGGAEISFRLLCSNDKVGGVIGRGGTIVKALQNETGASVSVGSSIAESDERVITVTAFETSGSQISPAQKAVVRIFARSIEAGIERGVESGSDSGGHVMARLLVSPSQVGCVMGKGGAIISEIRRLTGSAIRIISGDQVPKCASENDEVVQVAGDLTSVQDALLHVTGRLRDNILPNRMPSHAETGFHYSGHSDPSLLRKPEVTPPRHYQYGAASHGLDRQTTLTHGTDHLGLNDDINYHSSQRLWTSQVADGGERRSTIDHGRGMTNFRGGIELGSGSKSAIVTNTIVEIVVPDHCMGLVYGENGSNLNKMRQISGAKVLVHDPRPGTREGMVVMAGTPDQTQAAQSLLQAFILSGRPQ